MHTDSPEIPWKPSFLKNYTFFNFLLINNIKIYYILFTIRYLYNAYPIPQKYRGNHVSSKTIHFLTFY